MKIINKKIFSCLTVYFYSLEMWNDLISVDFTFSLWHLIFLQQFFLYFNGFSWKKTFFRTYYLLYVNHEYYLCSANKLESNFLGFKFKPAENKRSRFRHCIREICDNLLVFAELGNTTSYSIIPLPDSSAAL